MTFGPTLLIIEDDPSLGGLMTCYLEGAGYRCLKAENAISGMMMAERHQPDLILLDLGLPDEDGLVVLRRLRHLGAVPIIVVSGRDDPDNRIASLEMGADDFIPKPFIGRELVARVSGVLRRIGVQVNAPPLSMDGLTFYLRDQRLTGRHGEDIVLTPSEANILRALVRAQGHALTRDQLMDAVGNVDMAETTRSIDITISRLRAKLEVDRKKPKLILTVQGIGYRLKV